MHNKEQQLGLSGSCYWCIEAIFLSLNGVTKVEQGWISSFAPQDWFTEGIIVTYQPEIIALPDLIAIHLHTHSSTKNHALRDRYRSGVYAMRKQQITVIEQSLTQLQREFNAPLITQAYLFNQFKPSDESIQNYYYSDPSKPFCENVITPKLQKLLASHGEFVNKDMLPKTV